MELTFRDLTSDWAHVEVHEGLILGPNQSTELVSNLPCLGPNGAALSHNVVVAARLLKTGMDEVLARYADWPQPFKHMDLPGDPELLLRLGPVADEADIATIHISSQKPVKGLVFTSDTLVKSGNEVQPIGLWDDAHRFEEEPKWSDNALDVMPGDEQVIVVKGLKGRGIRFAYLGHEKSSAVLS
jgi:beta-mannosidase